MVNTLAPLPPPPEPAHATRFASPRITEVSWHEWMLDVLVRVAGRLEPQVRSRGRVVQRHLDDVDAAAVERKLATAGHAERRVRRRVAVDEQPVVLEVGHQGLRVRPARVSTKPITSGFVGSLMSMMCTPSWPRSGSGGSAPARGTSASRRRTRPAS